MTTAGRLAVRTAAAFADDRRDAPSTRETPGPISADRFDSTHHDTEATSIPGTSALTGTAGHFARIKSVPPAR